MAATAITPKKLVLNTLTAPETPAAVNATDGALVPYAGTRDGMVLICIENTDASVAYDIAIKKGNGLQAASADLALADLPAGEKRFVLVETGAYGIVSGTDAGKIKVTGENAKIKVSALYWG